MSYIREVIEHYAGDSQGDKVCGVGINDADYIVKHMESYYENGKRKRKLISICPFYEKWKSMIDRCYNRKIQNKYPCYIGCSVSKEWLTFSKFKEWMQKQEWENKHLDKDLLGDGKIYSAETCIFIEPEINTFITCSTRNKPSGLMTGVHHHHTGKFRSVIRNCGKYKLLGLYDTELEAHTRWHQEKLALAESLIIRYNLDSRLQTSLIDKVKSFFEG